MGDKATVFLKIVLIGAIYHLIRDILQVAGVKNVFTEIGHVDHEWCSSMYCDYVTFPVEIFIIAASITIIRRKRFGTLGISILIALLIGLFMWLWQ